MWFGISGIYSTRSITKSLPNNANGGSPCSNFRIMVSIPEIYRYTLFTLMRFKPRFSAVLQPQRTAGNRKYTARWTARFRDLPHVPRMLAEKLNMLNFCVKTVKELYWPQAKRKPSATFRKTTAAFRWPKYLRLSYCPNCALLSNHFLAHNLLCIFIFRLSLAEV